MKTIIVDDELWALEQLQTELREKEDVEVVGVFSDAEAALDYAMFHPVDFALLDVRMPGMDGLELGCSLRKRHKDVIIVYVSSYPEYFSEAYRNVRADYYMLKPYKSADVEDVLERARLLAKRQRKRVQVRTFGRFDIFIDEQVVQFRNAKAKELLALCVDRKGGSIKMEEAIDKLWEGSTVTDNVKTRYRKAVAYLNALFAEHRAPDVFVNSYGTCHINRDRIACDYYEFLTSNEKPHFFGEYMHEYSWAEETAAWLSMQMQQSKYR